MKRRSITTRRLGVESATILILTIGLSYWPAQLLGQATGTVAGLVVTTTGVPIEAAEVTIVGTSVGALTNASGRFLLLNVPVGERTIRVRAVGYRGRTNGLVVSEEDAARSDFTLIETPFLLDEIVVTGTGVATEKRQLGNTVAVLDVGRLANAPISTFSELVQGREPSVMALTSDGALGSGTRIRIRGSNSITMSNEPLVYVDGLRVDNSGDMGGSGRSADWGSPLDDINWEAVDRIEILKGPAAATLYGSEASSGVIQIFTKTGRSGPSRVTASAQLGGSRYPARIEPAAGFARDVAAADALSEHYGLELTPFEVFERDFMSDLFETGSSQTYSLGFSGGDGRLLYFAAGRYTDEDGPLGGESLGAARDRLRRLQSNASLTFFPTSDVRLRLVTSYADGVFETFLRNNDPLAPTVAAWWSKPERASCSPSSVDVSNPFGEQTPRCTGPGNPTGAPFFGTPRELLQPTAEQAFRHFTGSVSGSWAARSDLTFDATVGVDQVDERADFTFPFGWKVDGVSRHQTSNEGGRGLRSRTHRELTLDGRVSYSLRASDAISMTIVGGGQAFLTDEWGSQINGRRFPGPTVDDPAFAESSDGSIYEWSKVGVGSFVQSQVDYRDWLFATAGARFDRTSAFGAEAGSVVYPKASLSAVLTDLDGWRWDELSTLRLRAAFGQSGLQPGAFDRLTTYAPRRTPEGAGFEPENLGNPDLRPERATEWEAGLEAELLSGRTGIDLTFWSRTTRDALILRPFPASAGFEAPQLDNLGRLDAHGWELALEGAALEGERVTANVFANAAYLSQEVVDLDGTPPVTASGSYVRHRNSIAEGYAPGAFLGARLIPKCGSGVARTCFEPGVTVPFDRDGDGVPDSVSDLRQFLTSADAIPLGTLRPMRDDEDGDGDFLDHYLGKPTPDWQGSVGADVTLWNRLTIGSLFEYRAGHYSVANLTGAFRKALIRNVRSTAEVESTLSNPATRGDGDARLSAAQRWAELISLDPYSGVNLVEDADMLRWREASISYRVPESWVAPVRAQDVTVSVSARNLAVWTRYSGSDPEANEMSRCGGAGEAQNPIQCNFLQATEMFTLPLPRRLSLGVRVVF